MLYKPNGTPAGDLDRLILLNIWAHHLDESRLPGSQEMIYAGLGKPSYLLNEDLVASGLKYWHDLEELLCKTKHKIASSSLSEEEACEEIILASTAIDYLLPAGEESAKAAMATALSHWYGPHVSISPEDLIFTVGGAAAIRLIFRLVHSIHSYGKILTPCPYYSLYCNAGHQNHFYFINLMGEPGYRLSAKAVERELCKIQEQSAQHAHPISAILFCDPNNPMGYVVGEDEWKKIAELLKGTSADIPIILDEAYAELVLHGSHTSLLTVAPELKHRLIVMRSATKGFSASGERMAVMLCFNEKWREELLNETVLSYSHAPKSLQIAYAEAMKYFTQKKAADMASFYRLQVNFVQAKLKRLNLQMPDPAYHVEGAFYVIADLSALLGRPIPLAAKAALGREGAMMTDEDICYSLLFNDHIMLAPFSCFGGDPYRGLVRITCCGGIKCLDEMFSRLARIIHAAPLSLSPFH